MKKIGITGIPGFIGSHLANYLAAFKDEYDILPCEDGYFDEGEQLIDFTSKADVIVHLAGVNRHEDENFVYARNVELASKLVEALQASGNRPQVIFSSSTQETRDNSYGKGKKEARILLGRWAEKEGAGFAGLIIPNVFGPFGKPYYNSVVATFCHQINTGEKPQIKVDAELELIYIADLIRFIKDVVDTGKSDPGIKVPCTGKMTVSHVLSLLSAYGYGYLNDHIIPALKNPLETALFNTLRSYRDDRDHAASLIMHRDERGHLVEIVKEGCGGQSFFSFTRPGVTRGNHFHTRKIERFCVVKGEAVIRMRRLGTDEVIDFGVSGDHPVALDIPVFYTHNITNTGNSDLLTLFWSNEIYNPGDPDTYYAEV